MSTTEVPTPPSRTPPEPNFSRKRSRHENLEPDELLHLIDRLEDERSRSRWREGIYVSLLLHVAIFLFLLFGPRYILHQPRIISPIEAIKQRQKELTYLDLPPDALKRLKPKTPAPLSDKDRIAQSPHPTLDKKTLQQLEAMRRAGPPARTPEPRTQAQLPPAPAPAQPQAAPPAAAQRPVPQQAPMVSAPKPEPAAPAPRPTQPNFNTSQSAGDVVRQAARDAARDTGGESEGGSYGAGAAPNHQGLNAGVDVLSDTMGVNFGPYLQRVIAATYRAWLPIIPESARPPLSRAGKVGIEFIILPDGTVSKMILRFPSGDVALDRAAWGGITGASPYPPLPKDFKGPYLALRFGFYYNERDAVQ